MAMSRDIHEIVSKLSSDKTKIREEGVKLLDIYLEEPGCRSFCKFLSKNTAKLQRNEIPHSETWPYLLTLLIQCVATEISTSRKRAVKPIFFKTLKNFVDHAEDIKYSGRTVLLLPAIKPLFNHIWEVLRDATNFPSDYYNILQQLVAKKQYRINLRKRLYCSLVLNLMRKVELSLKGELNSNTSSKEVQTLHILLENPPGDFPDNLREELVKWFVGFGPHLRDEKVSCKIFQFINIFLLKDGPNLGTQVLEIHLVVREIMVQCWMSTHDRGLKNALILYARIQLKLSRRSSVRSELLEQLLYVVSKILDQSDSSGSSTPWYIDIAMRGRVGSIASSLHSLMELAASVIYKACTHALKPPSSVKRIKKDDAETRLKEGIMKGKWLWNCAFCFLLRNHRTRIPKTLVLNWFEGLSESFERIISEGITAHDYDSPLWALRSLQELAALSSFLYSVKSSNYSNAISWESMQVLGGWHTIWSCLMHWLPIFSNVIHLVDAALMLLGRIVSRGLVHIYDVPQEVWDLKLFSDVPSLSTLYFIACYFCRPSCQGSLQDIFHLRQKLLRAILRLFLKEEQFEAKEHMLMLFPAAVLALCAGCAPFPTNDKSVEVINFCSLIPFDDWAKVKEPDQAIENELSALDCSEEVLAEIETGFCVEVDNTECYSNIRLPRSIVRLLLHEFEDDFLKKLTSYHEIQLSLPELFHLCNLLCNVIYGFMFARLRGVESLFLTKMLQHLSEFLKHSIGIIKGYYTEIQNRPCLGSGPFVAIEGSTVEAFQSLMCSPLFSSFISERSSLLDELSKSIIPVINELLFALADLFLESSNCSGNEDFEMVVCHESDLVWNDEEENGVDLEMELDQDDCSKDKDSLIANMCNVSRTVFSFVQWKLDLVSIISSIHSVLPVPTWDILFNLLEKETNTKVRESILYNLCKLFSGSSPRNILRLVNSFNTLLDDPENSEVDPACILTSIDAFLESLLSAASGRNNGDTEHSIMGKQAEQALGDLGVLVNKVADHGLDWPTRMNLINCICHFVSLDPCTAQVMIERLFAMLQDADYRVRLSLARHIGVLFLTWEGHEQLFQDICSNFRVKLVMASKGKIVTAKDVLDVGVQSQLFLETAVITLAHLAYFSDKVEIEAIFMACVVAAMEPALRELVYAILDTLSKQLKYPTRSKYLEQLMGSLLSRWVTCQVSLVALVEIRGLFIPECQPDCFMESCCPWLLPPLILSGESSNMNWAATVTCEPLSELVKKHFVPIFAACMTFHCSNKSSNSHAIKVLQSSILHIADISEHERDNLIKTNTVAIVGCLLSLTSSTSHPDAPYFPKDTIVVAIRTIIDGLLDTDGCPDNAGLIDDVKIFRPDRVFQFLVGIHYQLTSALHPRHKVRALSSIEVLMNIIGSRAAISTTSCYLFNLLGQFISCSMLQEQCCFLLSSLIEIFKSNPSKDAISALSEQLQFLVSKLVVCCIPPEQDGKHFQEKSSRILSLIYQLTVDADPSLYEHIRVLEPFPELECFEKVRSFHHAICKGLTPRDQFFMFVKRSCYLPLKLRLQSLQIFHRKLLSKELFQSQENSNDNYSMLESWNCEPEIVSAVWKLVDMCASDDGINLRGMVADFVSRVGVGDPHRVVVRLPGDFDQKLPFSRLIVRSDRETNFGVGIGVSEELVATLLKMFKKYLLDESVTIVDKTARALHGILLTRTGQSALLLLDSSDRSFLKVHSKGVNLKRVEKLLHDMEATANATPLQEPSLWQPHGKTYEQWICPLVYSLIYHANDIVLRLCRDVALLKAEVAELLFPIILANIAKTKAPNSDLCQLISSQVQEHIFIESNVLIKSIQVILEAMNELRFYYVMERAGMSSVQIKGETPKVGRHSGSRGSRSPYMAEMASDSLASQMQDALSSCSWQKVYWLLIDYLVVAKAAIISGAYFTSVMYVEHWCEEHFGTLFLGDPDFSHLEMLPAHVELLVAAITKINEPDSIYGIIRSHKLVSQITTYEHEGNWNKALEHYDLLVRTKQINRRDGESEILATDNYQGVSQVKSSQFTSDSGCWNSYKGLMRSLQQTGCTHVLDVYCQGLTAQNGHLLQDAEFTELQYEAAWRAGNWDFSSLSVRANSALAGHNVFYKHNHFNENLHSCLRALKEGDASEFQLKLKETKQDLVFLISYSSKESTEHIYSTILKLQILDHLGQAWNLRWKPISCQKQKFYLKQEALCEPIIPNMEQLEWLNADWEFILKQTGPHLTLLEPFIAFRRVLFQILNCKPCTMQHLLQSASTFRKGARFSHAAAALHEFKFLFNENETSYICSLGRLEEAKLLRAQGQHEMAINLANYIMNHYQLAEDVSNICRLTGKWLAESRSSNSRTILEQYLKRAVKLTEGKKTVKQAMCTTRQCQMHFQLAHYTDALFRSYEERLASSEWQAALRLRKHKAKEFEALVKRMKTVTKGEKTDYSMKIQELHKQLQMDNEEAKKLEDDKNNFLNLALEGYQRCLVIGDKYDLRVVFRLVSLWFNFAIDQDGRTNQNVVNQMLKAVNEIQSYKFIPLVYQIASRMGSSKDSQESMSFQFALISLVKKIAKEHPYHTMFQLLALANGDRVKDKLRSRNSFVVDLDKKNAAENLLKELSSCHGALILQMRQMVEIYIKLAELETDKKDTNKRMALPRDVRSLRQLELVPVITANVPVDRNCQYQEGSFPYFKGLSDSIIVMYGINAPKVVECFGSDGRKYRQLAKSGNDDLRQDAVMEQFFGLVNTFLQNHCDTQKRRLSIRTYKVVPFTPSAGVLEWVDGTIPLGDYLLGSTKDGGAHGRYGKGDWSYQECREYMTKGKEKLKAFHEVCENYRPVMHYFFVERFLQPADWFEKRLSYTRSVAASSMVGYIVGLGDRHSMNILIDQATAEVVHIDLGVAFEQGLMLKTPERVPFRLTRDIIDGMGVTGIEGVFRRCCEETLLVMRTNKEALLTIIEVFIHDPLYKWALSPLKALQRQKETDDDVDAVMEDSEDEIEGNKDATRALLRVKQKLDGYEDGEMKSVQGQVQRLIQNAIDTENLCNLFPGWGAWL
ncbi:serine/threonine-protein kinase ATM isoform X2 [Amborella trichopoda]|uniref:serine/threonine-protein kinase ATM isoform X2 n=1 Tax=Amborella trichopoda TaxID=13333 RepID=UPI0009C03D35|nr:serine/threonine-protein kinase ATM isoform X2 [Amborella trichopoda]|eukprot:XP_020523147.1 serine/threonine-protein kinase ATM isoform X2 [Amborella trichopoda]